MINYEDLSGPTWKIACKCIARDVLANLKILFPEDAVLSIDEIPTSVPEPLKVLIESPDAWTEADYDENWREKWDRERHLGGTGKTFDLPLTRRNLGNLIYVMKRMGHGSFGQHIHVHKDGKCLMCGCDTGIDWFYVSKVVPESAVQEFCHVVGCEYEESDDYVPEDESKYDRHYAAFDVQRRSFPSAWIGAPSGPMPGDAVIIAGGVVLCETGSWRRLDRGPVARLVEDVVRELVGPDYRVVVLMGPVSLEPDMLGPDVKMVETERTALFTTGKKLFDLRWLEVGFAPPYETYLFALSGKTTAFEEELEKVLQQGMDPWKAFSEYFPPYLPSGQEPYQMDALGSKWVCAWSGGIDVFDYVIFTPPGQMQDVLPVLASAASARDVKLFEAPGLGQVEYPVIHPLVINDVYPDDFAPFPKEWKRII